MDAIRAAGVRIGVDPLGGAGVDYWGRIAERYGLDLTVVNPEVDPTLRFMTLDWDGKIRMDCSSPYAMASLIGVTDEFDVAFGNDADADRHGIVTPDAGLMNPNHFLAVAIEYLFAHRAGWPATAAIGKTLVSSSMIDRVAAALGRQLVEVPVGFKWFVPGLLDGSLGFGGEESAGASFLRRDGTVWTTDKDGILLDLLAAEIPAVTGRSRRALPALTERHGAPGLRSGSTRRPPATRRRRSRRSRPTQVTADELAGEPITRRAHRGAGQRRPDRRAQGRHRQRLVRRPPVGHRGRLQDLRRELPRRRPSHRGAGRRTSVGHERARRLGLTARHSVPIRAGANPATVGSAAPASNECVGRRQSCDGWADRVCRPGDRNGRDLGRSVRPGDTSGAGVLGLCATRRWRSDVFGLARGANDSPPTAPSLNPDSESI